MDLFTVDIEKCTRCNACIEECPARIIKYETAEGLPVPTSNADTRCINCGHCVAVCPSEALEHKNLSPENCPPFNMDWLPDTEKTEHLLRSRRSIRKYREKTVEREKIEKLLNIARYAPTASNNQNVSWMVIYDTGLLRKLEENVIDWMRSMISEMPDHPRTKAMSGVVAAFESGINTVCRQAPHLIVAHGLKNDPSSHVNCSIALTYLELAAHSMGLGACWAGYFNAAALSWQPMKEALGLPEENYPFGSMMLGYPVYKYHRLPERNEVKSTWL